MGREETASWCYVSTGHQGGRSDRTRSQYRTSHMGSIGRACHTVPHQYRCTQFIVVPCSTTSGPCPPCSWFVPRCRIRSYSISLVTPYSKGSPRRYAQTASRDSVQVISTAEVKLLLALSGNILH
eukprot:1474820-Rhodomonas_salina.4